MINYEFIKILLHGFFVFVQIYQLLYKGGESSLELLLEALLVVCDGVTAVVVKLLTLVHRQEFVELFNLFVQFERRNTLGIATHK